jgi:hypothetical protein
MGHYPCLQDPLARFLSTVPDWSVLDKVALDNATKGLQVLSLQHSRPVQVLSLQHSRPSLSRQESAGTMHIIYDIICYIVYNIVYDIAYNIVYDIDIIYVYNIVYDICI